MQVVESVKVSAESFYCVLIESLQKEVETVTGKKYNEKQLEGFRYKKRSNDGKREVKVHIHQLKKNEKYVISFSNGEMYTKITYEFKPISEKSCEITYREEYNKEPKRSLLRSPEKRAKKMLHEAEKYIMKQ